MSNTKRDKYLNEKITPIHEPYDFSSWEGFGRLREWSRKQNWWDEFEEKRFITPACGYTTATQFEYFVNPNRFANAVYEFLS